MHMIHNNLLLSYQWNMLRGVIGRSPRIPFTDITTFAIFPVKIPIS